MISNGKHNHGFVPIIILVLIILGLSAFFLYSKLHKPVVTRDNTADAYKNTNYFNYSTSNPENLAKTYVQTVYLISKDANQEVLKNEVTSSIFMNGPVLPVFNSENRKIYYLVGQTVFEYDINNKSKKEIYNVGKGLTVNYLGILQNKLYITQGSNDTQTDNKMSLIEFDLVTKLYKLIGPVNPILYGGVNILGKVSDKTIVGSFGGDGCAGFGEIHTIKEGSNKLLLNTGGGCDPDPLYIGFSTKLSSVVTVSTTGELGSQINEFIDLTNVDTGETKAIFDLKRLDKHIDGFISSPSVDYIYLLSEDYDKIYKFDLNTYTVIKELLVGSNLRGYYFNNIKTEKVALFEAINGDRGDKKQYKLLDLDTGSIVNSTYASPIDSTVSIGLIDNQIVSVGHY